MNATEQARAQALWAKRQVGALSASEEREYQHLKARAYRHADAVARLQYRIKRRGCFQ